MDKSKFHKTNSNIRIFLSYFKIHISIKTTKKNYDESNEKLLFQPASLEEVKKVI